MKKIFIMLALMVSVPIVAMKYVVNTKDEQVKKVVITIRQVLEKYKTIDKDSNPFAESLTGLGTLSSQVSDHLKPAVERLIILLSFKCKDLTKADIEKLQAACKDLNQTLKNSADRDINSLVVVDKSKKPIINDLFQEFSQNCAFMKTLLDQTLLNPSIKVDLEDTFLKSFNYYCYLFAQTSHSLRLFPEVRDVLSAGNELYFTVDKNDINLAKKLGQAIQKILHIQDRIEGKNQIETPKSWWRSKWFIASSAAVLGVVSYLGYKHFWRK